MTMPSFLSPVPDWLNSEKPRVVSRAIAVRELKEVERQAMFEHFLEKIEIGIPLRGILREDFRDIDYQGLLRWIHKDSERQRRFYEAQSIGAEIISAEIIEIADASDSLEDVQRSRLRIDTRWKLLGVWNRKRFGEVKQIEMGGTISILQALEEAKGRVIEGIAEEVVDVGDQ
ncbi:hypothetical protein LCGC14_0886580 [marine sediment metagenome]|uniref:Uncharacterized protein n=1 Tax=marine sediment metagenome TaxID=412755 RepID=A0A0F9RJU2_9ZZZZ